MMQDLELGIPSQQAELDLPQADDVRINDIGPVMRATGNGIELVPMTFSFPPGRQGGAPVFNFRSEGRHFAESNRCLVPASAFFEFTGKRYPKAKHRFSLKGSPITAIAGIWKPGQGNHPPSFTMLTTRRGRFRFNADAWVDEAEQNRCQTVMMIPPGKLSFPNGIDGPQNISRRATRRLAMMK